MEVFESFVNSLARLTKFNNLGVVVAIMACVLLASKIVALIVNVAIKSKVDFSFLKYLSISIITASSVLSSFEYINTARTFKTIGEIVVFNTFIIFSSGILSFAIALSSSIKSKRVSNVNDNTNTLNVNPNRLNSNDNLTQTVNCVKPSLNAITTANSVEKPTLVKDVIKLQCLTNINGNGEFDGYLDVSYLKSLINLLKEKNLSESDKKEIEDLEVYLMNFASRQPYNSERLKLSGYLSDFMKKLARYNAV